VSGNLYQLCSASKHVCNHDHSKCDISCIQKETGVGVFKRVVGTHSYLHCQSTHGNKIHY